MGKKKFDKNKGVTFKLVFRSEDEQANGDQTLSERIFSVIEADKKKADTENDKERKKILSQFTKEDLGQAPAKKAKPHHGAIKASAPPTDAVSSHTKGRDDLWITHVMRMKEQAKAQAEAEEAEEEEEEERRQAALLKKAKQPVKKAAAKKEGEEEDEEWEDEEGEDEEWEDEDEEEDDEEEEYEEIEEEDEEEETEAQDVKLFKKKAADEDEEQGNKNVLEKIEEVGTEKARNLAVTEEDFPELGAEGPSKPHRFVEEKEKTKEQVLEEMAEEEIDLKKVNVKGAVRMKRYDDMGLPMDGYNYYQHVVDPNSGGAPSFSFTTTYDKVQHLPEDIDVKKEKMNAEEKEVYEALEFEGEGAYQELEDDFFATLTKTEAVVVEEGNQAKEGDGKKVTFGDNEIKEILSTKDDPKKAAATAAPAGKDGIYSRKDFQKVLKQQVEVLKEKYKEERQKNRVKYGMGDSEEEEEEEVEEVSESWDEDDEENRPKGYIERLKWEDDVAAQQCVTKSMSSLDSEEDEDERRTRAYKAAASTKANSEYFPKPVARQTKLNIVKEEANTNTKKRNRGHKDAENKEEKEGKEEKEENESDSEGEEDEEEEKNKVEEVFKKREKGETKEEKKQRKAAIKQFKQERKDKKKKFKENFETKKKEHATMAYKQTNSLQGLSIYKLTV